MSDWKAKRRTDGWADKLIWLTPDAVAALAELKPLFPGDSEGDILSRALVYMAEHAEAHRTTAAPSVEERLQRLERAHNDEALSILADRVDTLEFDMENVKAGGGLVKPRGPGAGSVQRTGGGKRVSRWQAELVDFTARKMLLWGSDFNTSECWRQMQQQGIEAHAQGSGFYTWLSKPANRADVEERMRELREEQARENARKVAEDEAPDVPF